ncbi:cyclic nucleotide-binding domain protein [Leptospira broomii serovar Hurstbridge str. 5399]|uniref:Cyclic nucleotide-binding domain protein n=1 Tax=Leptospira broomii serovar Hurstbridge str. 5399 TaxID=1049789 RepID=T0F779_9LEPT|nr:cyclic nucleotide-binding domain-containing protein [Leptospira broomii]EQA43372.1 cyclic nucleotide-binding domain protein [Leptospira broomii serovar Hurstbridge str. 5399]
MQHSIEEILQGIYLFSSFSKDDLSKLAEKTKYKVLEQGESVYQEGNEAKAFYVVMYGTLKIITSTEKGTDVNVTTIATGDHFGEFPFLDQGKRAGTVEAMERCELLEIPFEHLQKTLDEDKELALKFYKSITTYLVKRMRLLTHDLAYARELKKRYS